MSNVASTIRSSRVNMGTALGRTKTKARAGSSAKQYRLALISAIIVFGLVVFMVASSAYCAKLQTSNNNLESNITHLEADIDSLNEQIANQTKIENIASVAVNQLHMVYPTSDNCINIDSTEAEGNGSLAAVIKDEAYN